MKWFFWTLPILLFVAQLLFTLNSQNQIRYEDAGESIRDVFWLQKGLVYDGVSTNVGWYGTLLILYNLIGFDIFSAKFYRLFLHFFALISLAVLLKKYLGEARAIVPLLVIGLSPTWLYLEILQTPIGIDFSYILISLFFIIRGPVFLGWIIVMIAWMSYPTFIFYLPALVFLHLRFFHFRGVAAIFHLGSVLSFLTPLVLAFLFIKNRSLLIFDPQLGSGIFRGAGSLQLNSDNFSASLAGVFQDLFLNANSYVFELKSVEFSLVFPILSVCTIFGVIFYALKKDRSRVFPILILLGTLLLGLILPSLTFDPSGQPGIRRATIVLSSIYGLFVLSWYFVANFKPFNTRTRQVLFAILGLLLLHHLIVYPINLIGLKEESRYKEILWLNAGGDPRQALKDLVLEVQNRGLDLECKDSSGNLLPCRYSEVYAAVAGSCEWNHLSCYPIKGWDLATDKFILLDVNLWKDYYFEH
ncbi:hypothetical protein HYS92_01970 [Candidatus Daviesbacteria bacterium]|nr:hypothetical protein [Candidatus Daviesbacteria bacterium]